MAAIAGSWPSAPSIGEACQAVTVIGMASGTQSQAALRAAGLIARNRRAPRCLRHDRCGTGQHADGKRHHDPVQIPRQTAGGNGLGSDTAHHDDIGQHDRHVREMRQRERYGKTGDGTRFAPPGCTVLKKMHRHVATGCTAVVCRGPLLCNGTAITGRRVVRPPGMTSPGKKHAADKSRDHAASCLAAPRGSRATLRHGPGPIRRAARVRRQPSPDRGQARQGNRHPPPPCGGAD